jgi:3-hydroxyacyl-CoA dehydrogenase
MGSVSATEVIAVVGATRLALSLARRGADSGRAVRLYHREPSVLSQAQRLLREDIERGVREGFLSAARRQRILDGILVTGDLTEALTHAEVVLEQDDCSEMERRSLLMRLGQACRASAVVITAGEPDHFMDYLPNPGRLLGLRCPGDPDLPEGSPLELVPGVETAAHALERGMQLVRDLGLAPIGRSRPG